MWINNAIVFVGSKISLDVASLDELLEQNQCPPCGSQTMMTEGFVPPIKGQPLMAYGPEGFVLLAYQQTHRLLPGPVIKEALDEKVQAIQDQEGRKVGRKERAELKEQITFELMPRAFTRSVRTNVLLDMERGRIIVDSTSASKAEEAVACLRKVLGSLPVHYPSPESAPHASFSNWLRDHSLLPERFTLGDRCDLKGTQDDGAAVNLKSVDLSTEEVLAHLETGMAAVRVNLCYMDSIEFDVNDKLELKRIRPLDLMQERIDGIDVDDIVSELNTRIVLQGGILREVLDSLLGYFNAEDNGSDD